MKTPDEWQDNGLGFVAKDMIAAIQSDAAADAEARLKEARELLSTGSAFILKPDWFKRRDAWLEREAKESFNGK